MLVVGSQQSAVSTVLHPARQKTQQPVSTLSIGIPRLWPPLRHLLRKQEQPVDYFVVDLVLRRSHSSVLAGKLDQPPMAECNARTRSFGNAQRLYLLAPTMAKSK